MTPVKKSAPPALDPVFAAMLKRAGLPLPVREYRFHPTRKWRLDYAWPDHAQQVWHDIYVLRPVALEQEGAVWVQGRHTRGSGFVKDMEKYNAAAALGWRVLRVTPQQLHHLSTIDLIRRALEAA